MQTTRCIVRRQSGGRTTVGTAGALFVLCGCASTAAPAVCAEAGGIAIEQASCLLFEDGGLLDAQRASIESIVRHTMQAVGRVLPVDGTEVRVAAGTATVIPEIGMGGRTNGTHQIRMVFNPASQQLAGTLESELFPLLAHELHHVARFRTVGFNHNLIEAMITEGLADQFSVEQAGIAAPRWSVALSEAQLNHWIEQSESEWHSSSYNHDAWFFGSTPQIPRWTGYAIGFELTRRYLDADPSRRAARLYGEPAASFVSR